MHFSEFLPSSCTTSMDVMVVVVVVLLSLGCRSDAVTYTSKSISAIQEELSVESSCRGTITTNISNAYGVIHSPVLQGRDNLVRCVWVINNPFRQTILLRFTQFSLSNPHCQDTHTRCCSEWVQIYTDKKMKDKRTRARKFLQEILPSHSLPFVFGRDGLGEEGHGRMCEGGLPSITVSRASTVVIEYCLLGHMYSYLESDSGGDGDDDGDGFRLMYLKVNTSGCIGNMFRCGSSLVCLSLSLLCNGVSDCPNNYDEVNCPLTEEQTTVHKQKDNGCGKEMWSCGVGTECYSVAQRCDKALQCSNARDELNCSSKCPFQIPCWGSEQCYMPYQRCDGLPDCTDGSDEDNCRPYQCNQQNGTYLCDNKRCIRDSWKCDELDDCRDGSDERQCIRNSMIGVAAIGGLLCSLMLIIALGCSGRLYALRSGLTRLTTGSGRSREDGEQGGTRPTLSVPRSRLEECLSQRELPPPYHVAVNDRSGFLHRAWGTCHPPWRLPSPQLDNTHPPPLPSLSPHSNQEECQQGEKLEDDVPLLSPAEGTEDDVPLLDDLFSPSVPSFDLDSDTRAAVMALSAVQSHINSMDSSDTEMI